VLNALLGNFAASADRIATLFEHLVFSQMRALAAARDVDMTISSYRTEHGSEVDFIVESGKTSWAVECRASRQVGRGDLRGLGSFTEIAGRRFRAIVVYLGDAPRVIEGVDVLPWRQFLRELDAAIA